MSPRPVESAKPGTLGNLTEEQQASLEELERLLANEPPLKVAAHGREGQRRRLVRFLRAEKFDAVLAAARIQHHAQWWVDYGMDNFTPADEFDEHGCVFTCGQDRWGVPTLVARPRVHFATSVKESVDTVRRCVYTMQRCVERLPPGYEKINLIYDAAGAGLKNFDMTFCRELVAIFGKMFPERMGRLMVINGCPMVAWLWSICSALLDPVTKEKICFCSSDFREALLAFVDEDHPYLRYALEVQKLPAAQASQVPLPASSPYVARWVDCVAKDALDPIADGGSAGGPTEAAEEEQKAYLASCKMEVASVSTADTSEYGLESSPKHKVYTFLKELALVPAADSCTIGLFHLGARAHAQLKQRGPTALLERLVDAAAMV